MRAYLSYQSKDDTSFVRTLLREYNFEIFDSRVDVQIGSSLQNSVISALRNSDIVLLIYSGKYPTSIFEVGAACALGKPTFSIISANDDGAEYLYDSTNVRCLPREYDKIKFSFEIFFKNLDRKKGISMSKSKSLKFYGGGEAIHHKFLQLANQYEPWSDLSEQDYVAFIKDTFDLSESKIILESRDSEKYADLSVWNEELSPILKNPIVVEVKKQLTAKIVSELDHTHQKYGQTNSYLIFYDQLIGITPNDLPNRSAGLYIQITDFVKKMSNHDLRESIQLIRNEQINSRS